LLLLTRKIFVRNVSNSLSHGLTYWLSVWKDLYSITVSANTYLFLSRDDRIHIERYLFQLPFLSSAYSLTRQLTLLTWMTCTQIPKIEFRGFFRVRYFRLVDTTERICENQILRVKCDSTEMLVFRPSPCVSHDEFAAIILLLTLINRSFPASHRDC